jgi:hypothetical protein
MQGIKVWQAKSVTSSWSLFFIILAILIRSGIRLAPINYNMQVKQYINKVVNIISKVIQSPSW